MNKITICMLTIFALLHILACENESLEKKLNGKNYKVTEYSTKELTNLKAREAPNKFDNMKFDGKKLTVNGLCRTFYVIFNKLESNSIEFGGFRSTDDGRCGNLDRLEDDLANVLMNAKKITLDGKNLIITRGNKSIKATEI